MANAVQLYCAGHLLRFTPLTGTKPACGREALHLPRPSELPGIVHSPETPFGESVVQ